MIPSQEAQIYEKYKDLYALHEQECPPMSELVLTQQGLEMANSDLLRQEGPGTAVKSIKSSTVVLAQLLLDKGNPGFSKDLRRVLNSGEYDDAILKCVQKHFRVFKPFLGPEIELAAAFYLLYDDRRRLNETLGDASGTGSDDTDE